MTCIGACLGGKAGTLWGQAWNIRENYSGKVQSNRFPGMCLKLMSEIYLIANCHGLCAESVTLSFTIPGQR